MQKTVKTQKENNPQPPKNCSHNNEEKMDNLKITFSWVHQSTEIAKKSKDKEGLAPPGEMGVHPHLWQITEKDAPTIQRGNKKSIKIFNEFKA